MQNEPPRSNVVKRTEPMLSSSEAEKWSGDWSEHCVQNRHTRVKGWVEHSSAISLVKVMLHEQSFNIHSVVLQSAFQISDWSIRGILSLSHLEHVQQLCHMSVPYSISTIWNRILL